MSQNSQENTCAGALLNKVAGLWPTILLNRDHSTGYFPGILRNLSTEHLRMEKNWKKSKCFEVGQLQILLGLLLLIRSDRVSWVRA